MIRKVVQRGIRGVLCHAFRRKESIEYDDVTLAGTGSECSTLVDFEIVDSEVPVQETETSDGVLDEENLSWNMTQSTNAVTQLYYLNTSRIASCSGSCLSLLDEEDCTWVKPRRQNGNGKKAFFNTKTSHPKAKVGSYGPDGLLEPEERSWV